MMYFSRAKTLLILGVCALGVLLALPNALPRPAAWVPWRTVHLGLDLRGGSYLLLEVDMKAVTAERLDALSDEVRQALLKAGLGYRGLGPNQAAGRVQFTLRDPTKQDAVLTALRAITPAVPGEFTVDSLPGNTIALTLSPAALRQRATSTIEQSIEIVRRRIDETGAIDPQITRQGDQRIVVQLPGIEDPQRIKALLGTTAKMTFHLVDEQAQPGAPAPSGEETLPDASGPPGATLVVHKHVEVDGADLTNAQAGTDSQTGQWVINFSFDGLGARRFAEVTRTNLGHRFAIVLDNRVISAPVIQGVIAGGNGQISGRFDAASATQLALLLRAGALPAPLQVIEERTVGPELGADSIRDGALALAAGFVLVVVFMAVFYGLFGWFANLALVINLILMVGILSLFHATLTLPGMAGLLLTLGMAVDANILINERIREECRNGRSPIAALDNGFRRALATILDSNATAFLAHVMLFVFGSGAVQGFALTITVGIITTLFTATVLVRLMAVTWFNHRKPVSLPIATSRVRFVRDGTRYAFMRARFYGLAGSAILSTASIVLFFTPGLRLGIDFKGGIVMEAKTPGPADFTKLRAAFAADHVPAAGLQRFGATDDVLIRLDAQPTEAANQTMQTSVRTALQQAQPGTKVLRADVVGASVSNELFRNGILALAISLAMILAYIWFRFEWQFAVGAVVTLLLDVTKTIGFLAITGIQFDLVMVAAILTIIGYSTNDKVVVYDRVRENLRKYKTMPLRDLIDLSINETLNRTLGTSSTVFLASLPLALFGGETLSGFAWVMLFGIAIGTSSSIMIAAPILLLLGENRLRRDAQALPPRTGTSAVSTR